MVSSIRTDNIIYKKAKQEHNRIIAGDFANNNDFKALLILRLNGVLGFLLVASILVSMFSYSIVIAKENKLSSINTKTSELSYENLDLQNKVDNEKSLYTINKKASQINFLKKADRVMEVNGVEPAQLAKKASYKLEAQPVLGY